MAKKTKKPVKLVARVKELEGELKTEREGLEAADSNYKALREKWLKERKDYEDRLDRIRELAESAPTIFGTVLHLLEGGELTDEYSHTVEEVETDLAWLTVNKQRQLVPVPREELVGLRRAAKVLPVAKAAAKAWEFRARPAEETLTALRDDARLTSPTELPICKARPGFIVRCEAAARGGNCEGCPLMVPLPSPETPLPPPPFDVDAAPRFEPRDEDAVPDYVHVIQGATGHETVVLTPEGHNMTNVSRLELHYLPGELPVAVLEFLDLGDDSWHDVRRHFQVERPARLGPPPIPPCPKCGAVGTTITPMELERIHLECPTCGRQGNAENMHELLAQLADMKAAVWTVASAHSGRWNDPETFTARAKRELCAELVTEDDVEPLDPGLNIVREACLEGRAEASPAWPATVEPGDVYDDIKAAAESYLNRPDLPVPLSPAEFDEILEGGPRWPTPDELAAMRAEMAASLRGEDIDAEAMRVAKDIRREEKAAERDEFGRPPEWLRRERQKDRKAYYRGEVDGETGEDDSDVHHYVDQDCGYWKDDGTEDGYCEAMGCSCEPPPDCPEMASQEREERYKEQSWRHEPDPDQAYDSDDSGAPGEGSK